jgi:hypothetical protein
VARSSAALLLCLLLGACAPMSESQCRSADWYQVGYRDADPYGLRPQIDRYTYECRAWAQASVSDYMRGWQEGYWEFTKKMTGSECCGAR